MYVIKRDGRREDVKFDKITSRIKKLCYGLNPSYVDPIIISQKVVGGVYPGVTTSELDELAAETAAYCSTQHPDFSKLAARISISNLHKNTNKSFSDNIILFYNNIHKTTGEPAPLIAKDVYEIVIKNKDLLNSAIITDRDFDYDYFAFKTLEKSYLIKINGKTMERPQQLLMRVAVGIHRDNIEKVLETYEKMSLKYFTHATPTLFNSGTPRPQLSSCFLLTMKDDSIEGIYDTLKQCASISKWAGGIGLSIHNIRASNSYIRGTNGTSNGIVPMLRVFNDTARYVDQGGGKRKGSFAIYLEVWHLDIFEFLNLRKNHGNELQRARDLFYGLWINDLFMNRVQNNQMFTLFCPNDCPNLIDTYGNEFEKNYNYYESLIINDTNSIQKKKINYKTVKAQDLWFAILNAQIETGTPYMLYKDAANMKSNQKNLGCIRSSNLCCEIIEYTSAKEVAVCNLASINLSKFVILNNDPSIGMNHMNLNQNDVTKQDDLIEKNCKEFNYNFKELGKITKIVTYNLNKVIDINYYPIQEAKYSNLKNRPIGIGVQALADTFLLLNLPFDSEKAKLLNKKIFETIYYYALEASIELAKKEGPYESYPGSPASKGLFQYNLWGLQDSDIAKDSVGYDWPKLRSSMKEFGLRNSLLLAPMPTASTAQILGNNESIEPFTSNMYNRRVLAGEFAIVNKYLMKELIDMGLWTAKIRNQIMADKGSIQNIRAIPNHIKDIYKTVWEIKQRTIIDMAADRGIFICQSQSLNLHVAEPTVSKLTSMHFYAWKKGLKTGMYYLRTKPKADAIQFTVDQRSLLDNNQNNTNVDNTNHHSTNRTNLKDQPEEEEECLACGS